MPTWFENKGVFAQNKYLHFYYASFYSFKDRSWNNIPVLFVFETKRNRAFRYVKLVSPVKCLRADRATYLTIFIRQFIV